MALTAEEVKQWLNRYKEITENIDSLCIRVDSLRERAYSPRTSKLDGMPHSSGFNLDRSGILIELCTEIETEIESEQKKARSIYSEINTIIKQIKGRGSADKKVVLQMKHLDGLKWEEITRALWRSKNDFEEREDSYHRRTFKIYKSALETLSEFDLSF